MDTAAVGVAQKEDDEERIDEQDIFDGVVLFLAAIARGCSEVLGADDAPLGAVMGKGGRRCGGGYGDDGCGLLSSGVTTVAAAASETPRRWARPTESGPEHRRGCGRRQQCGQEVH